jgi:hypothetical protein
MIVGMKRLQTVLYSILNYSVLAVFFFVPWWLRPDWLPDNPYYLGFLVTIPVILTVAAWLALGLPGLKAAFGDGRFWWITFLAALMLWALLSPQWSGYPGVAMTAAQQFALVALFALVLACAGPPARSVAVALAAGVVCQGIIVLMQVWLQQPVGLSALGEFEIRPFNAGLSIVAAGRDHLMRPYGMTIHPNVIGGYFTVALLCLSGWLVSDHGLARWRQLVRLGTLALGFYGLLITFSRSAWGALLGGLALIALTWWRAGAPRPPRQAVALAAAGAALLTLIFALTYPNYILARTGVGGDVTEERSISDRRIYIEIALQVIRENPLKGVGVAVFPWRANEILRSPEYLARGIDLRGDYVHNVPLLVLAELGIVGFVLFVAALAAGFGIVWRSVYDPFAVGLAAGAAALLAIGLLDHYPWSIFHFALLLWGSLGIALRSQSKVDVTPAVPADQTVTS